jgi:ribosomal protein L3
VPTNEAFVYCWTDCLTNKLYVGWHKGQPDDGYICSSKIMLQEYKNRSSDFTRQVLASGNMTDMINFETKILIAFNAAKDKMFYNMHNNGPKFVHNQPHTDETKVKFKLMHERRTKYAKGWKFNDEQLKRIRNARRQFWENITEEEKTILMAKRETPKKKEALYKMNKIVSECPHCNLKGNYGAMKRWHFDNCRNKNGSN